MKKIWEFFENMDECMYVADIDTHELIYMNKKALNIYGFKSVDEVAGKKATDKDHLLQQVLFDLVQTDTIKKSVQNL